MKPRRAIPLATYRLQLNRDFTFAQATAVVPYLASIGVSHCYVSPLLKARSGSMHGYDIVDHNSLNPEIGTPEDFDRFVATLHQNGMGLIVDVVPNHMAVMGNDNAWWMDVLENGESSAYAGFFDIDWHPSKEELRGKVLIPVLHDHYGVVLEAGELKLEFRQDRGDFTIDYRGNRFPIDPKEYPRVLQQSVERLGPKLGEQNQDLLELQSLIAGFGHLPGRGEVSSDRVAERNRDKEINKRRLAELCARSPEIAAGILETVAAMNGDPADPASFEQLHELIKAQAFRLANWRVASDDINYRRFFDTNDLAGICVEREEVFEATHRLILSLVKAGKVDGLRIDHPDGLYNPRQYFERLSQGISAATNDRGKIEQPSPYVVIEKILTGSERLPSEWPVCGTTGYDFANLVNGLFVDSASIKQMDRIYRNFADQDTELDELAYRCRRLIIRVSLASEVNVLANQLIRIALSKRRTCDFTLNSLREALTQVASSFPVYRTYVTSRGASESDIRYIRFAVGSAKQRSPAAESSIFDFIAEVLLTTIAEGQDAAYRNAVTNFAMKFQQFTSPVMAKGLEDTTFYRYNRLVSLNEVGSNLHRFGTAVEDFHAANQARLRDWPNSMLASSTHDSKRSEDVRARINVLSEIPELWNLRVRQWRRLNRRHKTEINDKATPSRNDEYLLYQTLLGAWPLHPLKEERDWEEFRRRIHDYMLKAIREAKENTSWVNPNNDYEKAMAAFVRALLTPGDENRFLNDFMPFQRRIARLGFWNSLSQTFLKLTAPGVPDIYQGNDVWDFSLVDPDNRRAVDYEYRRAVFEQIRGSAHRERGSLSRMLETPEDDQLKLYLTWRTLCFRQERPDVFQQGEYLPLSVEGVRANHVVAFARRFGTTEVLVVAPRLVASLIGAGESAPVGAQIWQDTSLLVPCGGESKTYTNLFTGDEVEVAQAGKIAVAEMLSKFPVALYVADR